MKITYIFEKKFSKDDTYRLFKSINWFSANFSERLHKALLNSQTVVTAWDGDKLVGLARALDDSEMVAFIHYVLVDPEYQGHHIASGLISMIKEKYKDYLYIDVMPEDKSNCPFYEKSGFKVMKDGAAMTLFNENSEQRQLKQLFFSCKRWTQILVSLEYRAKDPDFLTPNDSNPMNLEYLNEIYEAIDCCISKMSNATGYQQRYYEKIVHMHEEVRNFIVKKGNQEFLVALNDLSEKDD